MCACKSPLQLLGHRLGLSHGVAASGPPPLRLLAATPASTLGLPTFNSQRYLEGPRMSLQNASLGVAPLPPEDESLADQAQGTSHMLKGAISTDIGAVDSVLLKANLDKYEGVIVDPSSLPSDVSTFVDSLRASLAHWRSQNRKGVWLKLLTKKSNFVPPAIEAGFRYHHAEPTYVMLICWLPQTPCTLPANASHQVGVGAFILNDKEEVLAVQERNGPLKGLEIWKLPTGLLNQGEDIFEGAIREVKEETGIDAEFVELVGFRQGHLLAFEKSDLFFLCILRPLSSQIVKQDSEIAAAQWIPLSDFKAQAIFQEMTVWKKMVEVCIACAEGRYRGFKPQNMHGRSNRAPSYFYYNIVDLAGSL